MKNVLKFLVVCLVLSQTICAFGFSAHELPKHPTFEIYTSKHQAVILFDKTASPLDSITAHFLAEDVFKITGYKPKVISKLKEAKGNVIVIGEMNSALINKFLKKRKSVEESFKRQWESYLYKTVANPNKNIDKAFVIAGTNPRGTAYGVFNISKQIGVSPWYWWADVPVKKQDELILNQQDYFSKTPSVKYRGIFLNDEDWGLQPWAAKTFEPETGDIGPKTYSKIFELLLRLNANTIWPAMHPSTKAFFHYPGNAKMANLYNIVIGSSHAEPMLRNNVDEWDKTKFGAFNYKTNKDQVYNYWENRVKEAKNIDGIYTMGMRGVHDSGMEGVKGKDEAVQLLDGIIKDQRGLIKKYINEDPTKVPQAFTVYKEVLDLYKNGLEVPEDITLVWTDDNYGYIRALNNKEEQKRAGGGGVYYHASYWGRPHDYLWLSSTNPYLIQEEMMKAYQLNNKEIWILNVGDIKPAEYNTQLFMDMAYDAEKFQNSNSIKTHQQDFFKTIFGDELGSKIADIKEHYYQLAFERKPEFMGWSQTERTTPIYKSDYNALRFGDEIQKRIDAYSNLEEQADKIQLQLEDKYKPTFTQLVAYPVKAASNMNKKFLYRDKALTYADQSRQSAQKYKTLVNEAYENISTLTQEYNNVSNGKWKGIMDMAPRKLPVFENPAVDIPKIKSNDAVGISVEDTLVVNNIHQMPTFYVNDDKRHFVDVYLKSAKEASWHIQSLPKWLQASQLEGVFNEKHLEQRIYFSVNWDIWNNENVPTNGMVTLKLGEQIEKIEVNVSNSYSEVPLNSIVEKNGLAVVYAENFSENIASENQHWKTYQGLGHTKAVVQALPLSSTSVLEHSEAPVLTYEIYAETITDKAALQLVAIPTHPLTTDGEVRIAVQWNEEPIQMMNFKTHGRSSEWKQNVLTNKATKNLNVAIKNKGKQTLKIFAVDAGVLLDYVVLSTKKSIPYSVKPETKINKTSKE